MPLNTSIPSFFLAFLIVNSAYLQGAKILLDPAGDATHTGRLIGDTYERTCMLACAQACKAELEQQHKKNMIFLSRFPGDKVTQTEKAQLANQLQVDLVISLGAYQTDTVKPQLHIFYYDMHAPQMIAPRKSPRFVPYKKAYEVNIDQTKTYSTDLYNALQDASFERFFDLHAPIGFACTPLQGILSPALYIECGLQKAEDWHYILEPLIQTVNACLQNRLNENK